MDKSIGEKVKDLRISRNMVLKDLGRLTGLSVSHLSQFERGIGSLSLYSLQRVADALGAQLSYFMDVPNPHSGYFMRKYDYNPVIISDARRIYNRLGNDLEECVLEPVLVTMLPATQEKKYAEPHNGEEFIYVLEGILTVLIDDEEYLLYPGDSMHYQASSPHEWFNHTDRPVSLISVNTPRIIHK